MDRQSDDVRVREIKMFCWNCGKESNDNNIFCTNCGKNLREPSDGSDKGIVGEYVSKEKSLEQEATREEAAKNEVIKDKVAKEVALKDRTSKENTVKDDASQDRKKSLKINLIIIAASVAFALVMVGISFAVIVTRNNNNDKGEVLAQTETEEEESRESGSDARTEKEDKTEADKEAGLASPDSDLIVESVERPVMLSDNPEEDKINSIVPCVPEYTVNKDFSNVINANEYDWYTDEFKKKIAEDGFVVRDFGAKEFFEVYEYNRYSQTPNFVTVDSLMHTYHIYFAYLLKNIERNNLSDSLKTVTVKMLEASKGQYEECKGTNMESAAERNVAFFAVANRLLTGSKDYPDYVKKVVDEEYALVMAANSLCSSPLIGEYEDYTQYIPRGYYEGDALLEKYFRTMMWYGRIQFDQDDEDMNRSALLMTKALNDNCKREWESIYSVTSFFAGASDDLGYYDYMPAMTEAFGNRPEVSDFLDDNNWKKFNDLTSKMPAPRINSIPIEDGEDNIILGYRFMGQRFSIDATVMQELVYSRVGEESDNDKRLLPDVLDVPAALGSEKAYEILAESGATQYAHYDENLNNMKKEFNNEDNPLWKASLYAGWLNTLRPVLAEKGKGYPFFMQNEKWQLKSLELFAGSYTELKHDTVLYSKQVMAEMGGGWEEEVDDRGYVEPEPLVFSRFALLAEDTARGLDSYGYLSDMDRNNLDKLAQLARKLETIAIKELNNELCTSEEYDLIVDYGGQIEHFWYDVMKAESGGAEYISSDEYPAAIVVDIATDPNGSVLEAATGNPARIYVAVMVDGKIRIAEGSVYSFYEFEHPMTDRFTDSKWRRMIGTEIADYNDPYKDMVDVEHPEWVTSYRIDDYYNY